MASLKFLILSLTLTLRLTEANQWNHDEDGVDKYVTRPDIVSPRWQINYHDKDRSKIAPGYWFVAPYVSPIYEDSISSKLLLTVRFGFVDTRR